MKMIDVNLYSSKQNQNVDKYKEKAAKLFEKLNSLQESGEVNKSHKHKQILNQFTNVEKKVFEGSKIKEGWYSKIMSIVQGIQSQLTDQKNQQQKCQRAVQSWLESTERQLSLAFERFQKQKLQSQIAFQRYIDSKIDSFILKNKGLWSGQALIKKDLYIEQIDYLQKQHRRFLSQYKKQVDKLRKQTTDTIKNFKKLIHEQLSDNQQEKIVMFMKTVHQQISNKIGYLRDQRDKIQEKVLSVLQKIVNSCLNQNSK